MSKRNRRWNGYPPVTKKQKRQAENRLAAWRAANPEIVEAWKNIDLEKYEERFLAYYQGECLYGNSLVRE